MGHWYRGGLRSGLGLALWLGVSHAALAQAVEPSQQPAPQEDATQVDEIIVTGLRRSIQDAIETKRDSTNIVDSITAQDVGKLPDQNVVDSLSRIPGVQITRSRGDGAGFTIRGISQNLTLVNGRPLPTGLDNLSSDIIASVDVIKSPSAEMIEGALGGTVNLRTQRPLTLPDGTFGLRFAGQYGEVVDDTGGRGSILLSKRLFDDTLGVLLNVAYQDIRSNQQQFESQGYNAVNDIDGNGDGVNDPGLLRIARFTHSNLPQRRERLTATAAVQWRPTDELDFIFEATYNDYDSQAFPERLQVLNNSNDVGTRSDASRTVVSGRFNGVTYRPLVFQEDDESDLLQLGARADWNRGPWKASVDLSYAKADAPRSGGTFTLISVPRAGRVANVDFNLLEGDSPGFVVAGNFDLNDPANYEVTGISDSYNVTENEAVAARFDVQRDLDIGFLRSLEFGYRYEDRSETSLQRQNASAASVRQAFGGSPTATVLLSQIPYTPNLVRNFFDSLDGNFPRSWLGGRIDGDAARAALGYTEPPINLGTFSDVSEEKHAIYIKLNVEGEVAGYPVRGNIGGRYLETQRQVDGQTVVPTGVLPIEVETSFSEFLPSATLVVDVREDLLLRMSAARVQASPSLAQLRSGYTFSVVNHTGSGGNPLLDPFQADQADVSLEWYFGEGNILAGSLFYKKVSSFTVNSIVPTDAPPGYGNPNNVPLPLQITRPINGNDGEIRGFEINYQQALTFLPEPLDGLGYQVSYTFADSEAPNSAGTGLQPLPNLSENSYSLIGYYDKGPLEARLAYTYRDGFLAAENPANTGGNQFSDEITSLDGSVSLDLNEAIKLTLDVQNILQDPVRIYRDNPDRLFSLTVDDRRWFLGVSAIF